MLLSGLEIGRRDFEERWEEISGGRTALFWFGMWVQRKLSELRLTGGLSHLVPVVAILNRTSLSQLGGLWIRVVYLIFQASLDLGEAAIRPCVNVPFLQSLHRASLESYGY